ncbi:unnamed protein product [Polarella glacialis]|uniref:Uncharacterized protein n=1 Tax=Polarella glacialis TaxID=89957 RepID=A0A813I5U3_POLGL|nr:unnamed protein product [Polarella glacialis]CAE8645110.1 unnamed protein product [Polarella glacialis]
MPHVRVREVGPLEVFNIPIYEVPPMLDVRRRDAFRHAHIVCAVSAPVEDGPEKAQLMQRILDHDCNYGWMLQHPFVIVHDDETKAGFSQPAVNNMEMTRTTNRNNNKPQLFVPFFVLFCAWLVVLTESCLTTIDNMTRNPYQQSLSSDVHSITTSQSYQHSQQQRP